jgi:hypothetical protein
MRMRCGNILVQFVILNLFCSLTGLLAVKAMHEGNPLAEVQTHTVLVENASPTW